MPKFSIVIPAKGRPHYTWDAAFSALHQDFDDFNVTLSNNGADLSVRSAVAEFMSDPRFHYVEQPDVLDVASHWDAVSRAATGDYLLILTNRCVLKHGVLRRLADYLKAASGNVDLVSWRYDSYYNASGLLSPCPAQTGQVLQLSASDELKRLARDPEIIGYHSYTLPRGMNACVSRSLIERIRARGAAFRSLIPDVRFAFSCLLNAIELTHFNEAFYISQGMDISSGDGQIRGDFRPFLNSYGLVDPWKDVPIKAPLVFNAIAQDFLESLREYERHDIRSEWNRTKYYSDCLTEIKMKRNAGILSSSEIDKLEQAANRALQNEDESVQSSVTPTVFRRALRKAKSIMVRSSLPASKPYRSVLEAAGFEHRSFRFRSALHAAGFN